MPQLWRNRLVQPQRPVLASKASSCDRTLATEATPGSQNYNRLLDELRHAQVSTNKSKQNMKKKKKITHSSNKNKIIIALLKTY